MGTLFDCPNCKARLRVEGNLPENRQLRCRKCGATFSSSGVVKTFVDTPPNNAAYEVETPLPAAPAPLSPSQAPTVASTPSSPKAPPPPSVPDPLSPSQAPTLTSASFSPKAPPPPPPPPLSGDMTGLELGGCRLEQKLGQGGMGAVYKAHHIALDIPVAVKVLPPYMAASHPRFIERFIREARAAARIQHQNIVGVTNVGEERGLHFIVMQFVDGETLQSRISARERLSPAETVAISMQLCEALIAAQANGIVHRDIKPDNIMIDRFGVVRLADLGLAKNLDEDSHLTASGMGMGTPHYMPPEQAANAKNADHRSDIYSLGCTLFEMLTGRVPYDGESGFTIMTKHSNEPVPDAHEIAPDVPAELAAVVKKMMAKKPEDRQQTAAELLADLQRVAPLCGSVAAPAPRRATRAPLAPRTRRMLYAAASALVLCALGAAAWHFLKSRKERTSPEAVASAPAAVQPSAPTPTSTLRTAASGGIRLEDWVPSTSSEAEPRRPAAFKDLRHNLTDGVLTLRNEFADRRMAITANKVRLDGDFDVEFEARGVVFCAIVDPRLPPLDQLRNLRIFLTGPDQTDDNWHKVLLRRRGADVYCRVDDREVPSRAYVGDKAAQGFLSLSAKPGTEMQVRNCVITPLSTSTPSADSQPPGGPPGSPGAGAPPHAPDGPSANPRPFRPRPPRTDQGSGQSPPARP